MYGGGLLIRTFFALGLMTCEPSETWPSPMMNCGGPSTGKRV
jgi:hypothetical protein